MKAVSFVTPVFAAGKLHKRGHLLAVFQYDFILKVVSVRG